MMRYKYFVIDRMTGHLKGAGYTETYDIVVDIISADKSTIKFSENNNYKYGDLVFLANGLQEQDLTDYSIIYTGAIQDINTNTNTVTAMEMRATLNDANFSLNYWNIDTYHSWEQALWNTLEITNEPYNVGGKVMNSISIGAPNKYTTTTTPNNTRWDYSKDVTEFVIIEGVDLFTSWFNKFDIGLYFDGITGGVEPSGEQMYIAQFAFANRLNMDKYPTLQIKNNDNYVFRDWDVTTRKFDSTVKNGILIRNHTGANTVSLYQKEDGGITDVWSDAGVLKPVNYTGVYREEYGENVPSDNSIAADKLGNSSFNHSIKFTTDIDNKFLNGDSGTIWDNVNVGQRWNIYYDETKYESVLTGYSISSSNDNQITLMFGKVRNRISFLMRR